MWTFCKRLGSVFGQSSHVVGAAPSITSEPERSERTTAWERATDAEVAPEDVSEP